MLKSIIELPFRIGSAFDRLGNSFDAHQFLVRQPEHLTVTRAIALLLPPELSDEQLANPEHELVELDITARFQTFWSLYENLQVARFSAVELSNRLNLGEDKLGPRWLLMISFRIGLGPTVYTLPILNSTPQFNFPPYQPGKRVMRPIRFVERIEAVMPETAEGLALSSPLLKQLLGPKADLWASTGCATPVWLLLRLVRRQQPKALAVRLLAPSGQLFA